VGPALVLPVTNGRNEADAAVGNLD
jgi:hypothetical protein